MFLLTACSAPAPIVAPVEYAPPVDLSSRISVQTTDCTDEGAGGTVVNHSDQTVTVFIRAGFLDGSGVIVDSGIGEADGVRPGETARWTANYLGSGTFSKCRAEVSDVYPVE